LGVMRKGGQLSRFTKFSFLIYFNADKSKTKPY
jgi:hypothetical protein